jgi:tetrahydromethanopterin S-methyltransferase subunit B
MPRRLAGALLAPEPVLLEDPVHRVLEWQEDVVRVDEDATVEPRQDLEVQVDDVPSYLDNVRRVYE